MENFKVRPLYDLAVKGEAVLTIRRHESGDRFTFVSREPLEDDSGKAARHNSGYYKDETVCIAAALLFLKNHMQIPEKQVSIVDHKPIAREWAYKPSPQRLEMEAVANRLLQAFKVPAKALTKKVANG